MRNYVVKITKVLLVAVCINCALTGFAFAGVTIDKSVNPSVSFETGAKYAQGAIKVIDLKGTWHKMGRQYGKLMKKELRDVYFNKMEAFMQTHPEKRSEIELIANERYAELPYKYKQVMQGISETSGLNLEQVKIANAVEYASGVTGCSGLAAWQDYTKSNTVIYGRNYDFFPSFKKLNNDVVVAIYHPSDNSLSSATVGYTGEIYAVNGLNEKGIFMELNNGGPSDLRRTAKGRIHGTISLMSMLFDADALGYVDKFFATTATNAPYIIGVADKDEARAYEWATTTWRYGQAAAGKLVLNNHFTNPLWDSTGVSDATSWRSLTRRQNLLSLAEEYKGKIDAELMQDIMSRSISDGGALSDLTVYQLVVEPQKLELWLNVIGTADGWTKIRLKTFF